MQAKTDEKKTNDTRVVSRDEWIAARKELLAKEKESTRRLDALSAERRKLPMVKIDTDYVFDGPNGRIKLIELFGNHRQLLVYHFMFDPVWEEGCKHCSHFIDNVAGSIVHLAARNTSFAAISRAPLSKLNAFKKRMGWNFPWLSSLNNNFNYDFHITLDEAEGSVEYNYTSATSLLKAGKIWGAKGEMPGMSVFLRDGADVLHTYSAYQRGLDLLLNTYCCLDLTPLGRQEEGQQIQAWLRHHDRYPA